MYENGNFIPVIADQGRIAAGETPVTVEWNYLSLANRDALAGNPDLEIVVPKTGVIAGPYAGAISAYAPHPNAAKLWWEFVMSDEGQLLYLKGYAYPIRYNDMAARGVIPADLAAKLPPAEDAARAVFLTVDQLNAVQDLHHRELAQGCLRRIGVAKVDRDNLVAPQSTPTEFTNGDAPLARPHRRGFSWTWLGVAPFFLFAILFLFLPSVSIFIRSFEKLGGGFTLQNFVDIFNKSDIRNAYAMSLQDQRRHRPRRRLLWIPAGVRRLPGRAAPGGRAPSC